MYIYTYNVLHREKDRNEKKMWEILLWELLLIFHYQEMLNEEIAGPKKKKNEKQYHIFSFSLSSSSSVSVFFQFCCLSRPHPFSFSVVFIFVHGKFEKWKKPSLFCHIFTFSVFIQYSIVWFAAPNYCANTTPMWNSIFSENLWIFVVVFRFVAVPVSAM